MTYRDQLREARRWVIAWPSCQASVDDRTDAVDSQRRFGNIGRYNDAPLTWDGLKSSVLLFGAQCSVERQHDSVGAPFNFGDGTTNLANSWQKDEHVSGFVERFFDRGSNGEFEFISTLALAASPTSLF